MAVKEFDPEDPMLLNGTVLPLRDARQAARVSEEMAECFIEEYLLVGYSPEQILYFFKTPFYRATHAVYRERGEAYVRGLIRKVVEGESHA